MGGRSAGENLAARSPAGAVALLIAEGSDVKTVQARLRHASAKTALDTYGHLWPDRDESTRGAIEAVFSAHADSVRTASAGR